MASNIPILTDKGRTALAASSVELSARCRSILVQIDGKRTIDEVRTLFKGLDGLDAAIHTLVSGGYVALDFDCKGMVKDIAVRLLGAKSGMIVRKIDELHQRYGDACWDHLDEVNKAARLFYGEVLATALKSEIEKALKNARQ